MGYDPGTKPVLRPPTLGEIADDPQQFSACDCCATTCKNVDDSPEDWLYNDHWITWFCPSCGEKNLRERGEDFSY